MSEPLEGILSESLLDTLAEDLGVDSRVLRQHPFFDVLKGRVVLTYPLRVGSSAADLARWGENWTWGLDVSADNDSTYVTVHETASGRGVLVSFWIHLRATATTGVTVKITIDGGTPVEEVITDELESAEPILLSIQADAYFASSLKVEMKLTDAQSGWYGVVTNIE